MNNEEKIIREIKHLADSFIRKRRRQEHVFALEANKTASLIVDMQNFACNPEVENPFSSVDKTINNINRLIGCFRKMKIPIIWIRHNFTLEKGKDDAGLYPVFHGGCLDENICNLNSGTDIYSKMDYDDSSDIVVTKNRYSAFSGKSKLREKLELLGKNQLIITGVASNVCVETTVRDAMQLDYQVTLVQDATATFNKVYNEITLSNVKLFFGDVKSADEIINELKSPLNN